MNPETWVTTLWGYLNHVVFAVTRCIVGKAWFLLASQWIQADNVVICPATAGTMVTKAWPSFTLKSWAKTLCIWALYSYTCTWSSHHRCMNLSTIKLINLVPRSSNTITCNTLAVIEGLGTRLPSSAFDGWMHPCHIAIQPLLLAVSNDMGKDDCWSVSYPSLICEHFSVFCGPASVSSQFP